MWPPMEESQTWAPDSSGAVTSTITWVLSSLVFYQQTLFPPNLTFFPCSFTLKTSMLQQWNGRAVHLQCLSAHLSLHCLEKGPPPTALSLTGKACTKSTELTGCWGWALCERPSFLELCCHLVADMCKGGGGIAENVEGPEWLHLWTAARFQLLLGWSERPRKVLSSGRSASFNNGTRGEIYTHIPLWEGRAGISRHLRRHGLFSSLIGDFVLPQYLHSL